MVDWRDAHGRFSDVEELREVSGIGPSLLERVRDQVHV
ncbi:MAG TPA: helix-hairpin-helix domain-containing protein [Actinotalea sp.]